MILFHDDPDKAFEPLYNHVGGNSDVLGQYMYMCHDDQGVYHYKHFGSRSHVQLSEESNLIKGELEDPDDW